MRTAKATNIPARPSIRFDFTRREFLVSGGAAMLFVGCGGPGGDEASGETRTVEHAKRETEVPARPEKIAAVVEFYLEDLVALGMKPAVSVTGTAEVPENVERIVAVGFNEADFVLALGIVPVGVRDFIGPYPEETRPWAQEMLGDEESELVGGNEINFEAVAALEPDLILGIYSFMSQENYDLLAEIAPTVAQPAEYADGATPWQEQMLLTSRALSMEASAEEVVAEVEGRFDEARENHPEFEGKTAAVTFAVEGEYGLLTPDDLRTLLFTSLGFRLPEETGSISRERVDLLDEDVLIFLGTGRETLEDDELVQSLTAAEEGRIIYFGDFSTDFAGALGYSSPLSLPFALEEAVPQLAAAVDGDPETEVESAS